MGHNRAGDKRRARLRRHQRELERLAKKSAPGPKTGNNTRKGDTGKGA